MSVARVSVRILDKEYQIACPVEERTALLDAAELLNARMKEIRDSGKVVGLDRIAVIAALNISNELIAERNEEKVPGEEVSLKIREIRERVEKAVGKGKQLEF
ncbi:MAG: cell division protein ZapA [Gammaproteobacteria bacterium]|nr:cell division protein ZapA [Gammaproteobacteria bacterium]NNL17207.1 cell division protein ZapA [Boseongicola sp.]